MLKGALVGALALTVGMMSLASAQPRLNGSYEALAPSVPRVTEANIARLKSVLNLRPHQVAHWGPVETALRALAREQRDVSQAAMNETAAISLISKMRQLSAAAAPLIHSLDETQRRDAMALVQRLGYQSLVATF